MCSTHLPDVVGGRGGRALLQEHMDHHGLVKQSCLVQRCVPQLIGVVQIDLRGHAVSFAMRGSSNALARSKQRQGGGAEGRCCQRRRHVRAPYLAAIPLLQDGYDLVSLATGEPLDLKEVT